MATSDLVLEVDFNQRDASDRVIASLRFSNSWHTPDVGEWIRLVDAEGDVCVGQVEEVHNLIVSIRADWGTWISTAVIEVSGTAQPDPSPSFRKPLTV